MRITWLPVYRVRRLCQLAHGYDPVLDGVGPEAISFQRVRESNEKDIALAGCARGPAEGVIVGCKGKVECHNLCQYPTRPLHRLSATRGAVQGRYSRRAAPG